MANWYFHETRASCVGKVFIVGPDWLVEGQCCFLCKMYMRVVLSVTMRLCINHDGVIFSLYGPDINTSEIK